MSRRRRELGVRLALGASRATLARMIVTDGLMLTLIGVALGIPAAIAAGQFLRTLLFGVTAADPAVLVLSSLLFLVVGASAGVVPAMRAAGSRPRDHPPVGIGFQRLELLLRQSNCQQ